MGSGDQQVITNDGDRGSYFGPIAFEHSKHVDSRGRPRVELDGTTNPQAAVIAIVFGEGVGQYSFLQSYSDRTINLLTPWKVLPNETSVVVIAEYQLNMSIAHNTITNTFWVPLSSQILSKAWPKITS
jgi:hypothetical protein